MGFLSPSSGVCYFQVSGTLDKDNKRTTLPEKLAEEGFQSIENSAEELATGWVELGGYDHSDFADPGSCWRDHLLCFTLRQDRRRVPSALLKRQISILSDQFLAEKQDLNFVPKAEKSRSATSHAACCWLKHYQHHHFTMSSGIPTNNCCVSALSARA